jgi:glycosyltransferase involved in cell wall biosynthesis
MHRLLVNALSVTNQSGLHVLLGHMDQVANVLSGSVRLVVLCRRDMDGLRTGLGDRADRVFAPAATRRWLFRAAWERLNLARIAREQGASLYFTPSGIAAHLPPEVKQIVFCQNPWALVPAARRRRDAPKAWLQRRAYRRALRVAHVMIFNSRYMQQAYRENAGFEEKHGIVVHQAADDAVRGRAADLSDVPRKREQILSVSAMAPHKNVEALLRAFAIVRSSHSPARLVLAGAWPDAAYERKVRALAASLGITAAVEFAGHVTREQLDRFYAESRIFCLMSRCESFGIPAIEAQLFGTPVVTSTVCAMPEIGGAGAICRDPDDIPGIAATLNRLLDDNQEWARLSALARLNADRFAWSRCSRPLVDLIAELARSAAPKSFP